MTPIFRLPPYRVEALFAPTALAEQVDWSLSAYNVPAHWMNTKGQGIKVAVLDTGEPQHPDLTAAIDRSKDFTGSRSGPVDRQGHGTHTAGTIAARQDGKGVIGVAPECRLLIGKVLGDDGSGSGAGVAAGIDWACQQGADIISMSLGSAYADPQIKAAIDRAAKAGKFIIAAAGNDGQPNSVNYPARWNTTVAVSAVDRNGRLTDFSSQGPQVDIASPGQDILSTYLNGGYAKLSGTSMATPFVAGVTALCLALHRKVENPPAASPVEPKTPLTTIAQLLEHLKRTAKDAGPQGHDPQYGWGLVWPDTMLAPEDAPVPAPAPTPVPGVPPSIWSHIRFGVKTVDGETILIGLV